MSSPTNALAAVGPQTEYYQLVQAAVYHADGLWGEATFDLYADDLPGGWGYLLAAGLDPAIDAVMGLRFDEQTIAWLRRQPTFSRISPRFFDSLQHFRFQGDIFAVAEGSVVFAREPVLRVSGPLPQVGLLEALLVQHVGAGSGAATRAARICRAARGRPVVDFGARRCGSVGAAWAASRGAWIGGAHATTNTHAAARLGIPPWWVMSAAMLAAYDQPSDAFAAASFHFPQGCHFDLPASDPWSVVQQLRAVGPHVSTVRLTHPDLSRAAVQLRAALDAAGLQNTRILVSGGLNARAVSALVDAPVDLFGVGAALAEGALQNRPRFSYRIAELVRGPDPTPVTASGSAVWPGRKQLIRYADHDVLCLDVEAHAAVPGGVPMLEPVVIAGERVRPPADLSDVRARAHDQLDALPDQLHALDASPSWPVRASAALTELATRSGA